jgi:hypothetical protein
VDFTRDFKGVFNKPKFVKHLLENGFKYQNEKHVAKASEQTQVTIIDNDMLVGRNCLSFIANTSSGIVRYKFYNKFVQYMESPGVRSVVGNHFADWCNNPETELKKAIDGG